GRVLLFRHQGGEQALAVDLHHVGHFRREDVVGAALLGLLELLRERGEIVARHAAGAHRDQSDTERGSRRIRHAVSAGAARSASRRPAASSARSSSLPPTWVMPMKICGTVLRPLARWIISARRSGLPVMSISVKTTPLRVSSSLAA